MTYAHATCLHSSGAQSAVQQGACLAVAMAETGLSLVHHGSAPRANKYTAAALNDVLTVD